MGLGKKIKENEEKEDRINKEIFHRGVKQSVFLP